MALQGRLGADLARSPLPLPLAGPALFVTRVQNQSNGELSHRAVTDTSVGFKVGAGASWQVWNHLAFFGEYRFTHVRVEPVLDSGLSSLRVPLQSDLNTHYLLAGLSWRF